MPARISYDDLPTYRWPMPKAQSGDASYYMIQARDNDLWLKKWILVDSDGLSLARVEFDEEDEITADDIANEGCKIFLELHGLTSEESGDPTGIARLFAIREPPPRF